MEISLMTPKQRKIILRQWHNPTIGPGDRNIPKATEEQLQEFERDFGVIPEDYRWFLKNLGGGGVEPLDTIFELPKSHREFRSGGWTLENTFVVGWDNGNPFGIELTTGEVLLEDHDFGGIHLLAPSFAAYLLEQIYGDPLEESFQDWDDERIERFKRTGDAAPKKGWPSMIKRLRQWAVGQVVGWMLREKETEN